MVNRNFNLEKRMFNSSSIADYMGCPRLFYWKNVRGLVSREPKAALTFGSVFHSVLLEWYKSGNAEKAMEKWDEMPTVMTDDHRTKEWGQAIFKEYVERYKTETGKTLHLEVNFRLELGGRIYSGTIDRIENWLGSVYVTDHKTTKMLGLSFFNAYRPHPQIDGYCWACRETCGKCAGAVINGISVAKNPKERFQRFPSPRSDAEISRWREDFIDVTDHILADLERGVWRMNTTWCNRWGRCPMWDLCVYHPGPHVENEMREKFIETNFKRREEEKDADTNLHV